MFSVTAKQECIPADFRQKASQNLDRLQVNRRTLRQTTNLHLENHKSLIHEMTIIPSLLFLRTFVQTQTVKSDVVLLDPGWVVSQSIRVCRDRNKKTLSI